jgi:hypothetical protein
MKLFPHGVCVFLSLAAVQLSAQERTSDLTKEWSYSVTESWEPDDVSGSQVPDDKNKSLISPFTSVTLKLIRAVEMDRSEVVNFCPFKTSCARFAYQVILHRGLFHGGLQFIDRYYYRKNPTASYLYPLVETEEGILKLDDDFFLKK